MKKDIGIRKARRMPPKDVAEMIVDGVKEDPEFKTLTESHFGMIVSSFDQWK